MDPRLRSRSLLSPARPATGTLAAAGAMMLALFIRVAPGAGVESAGPGPVPAAAPGHAPRIVSLAPSLTESLVFVGARAQLAGRTRYCVWPPAAVEDIPVLGGMADPSLEALLAAHPDLVVATSMTPRPVLERIASVGLRVEKLGAPGIDGMLDDLERVAALAGTEARERIDGLRKRVTRLRATIAPIPEEERPWVLILYGLDGLHSAGEGTFPADIIRAAGGRNAVRNMSSPWPTLSFEQIVAWDPDVILVTADHEEEEPAVRAAMAELPERPVWSTLAAVQDGRVLLVGDSILSIPGPRTVDAVERLARMLHPDRFSTDRAPDA